MYSSVSHLLDKLGDLSKPIKFARDDMRIAVAVLYYQVILVDGHIRDVELSQFRELLGKTLHVSEDELMYFEDEVLRLATEDKSLFPLTKLIRKLPIEKRREILDNMKAISLADQEFHEFEINMVERASELLGLKESESGSSGQAS